MPRLTKFLPAVLFLTCAGLAWNNSGLVQCDGLFLLDRTSQKVFARACSARDSLQMGDWAFGASIGRAYYRLDYHRNRAEDKYSWNLKLGETLNTGHISLSKDFRFFGIDANVSAMPAIGVSPRFHLPDSLFHATASINAGLVELSGIHWHSDWQEDYVPEMDGTFRSHFLAKSFSAGSKFQNHLMQGEFSYGETSPAIEEQWGYAFSDSSDYWSTGLRYRYDGNQNIINLSYTYVYADLRLFGLMRENGEEVSEKRFAYLPLGIDLNLFQASFRHRLDDGDSWKARALYGTLEVNSPWESRRFYETFAPNRALKSSVIKTLSFSVFQRSFRVYGDIDGKLADAGLDYEWNLGLCHWRLLPKVSLDGFYISYEAKLNTRSESSGFFYVSHSTATWEQDGYVMGMLAGLGMELNSPSNRFFSSVAMEQIIPIRIHTEKGEQEKAHESHDESPDDSTKKSGDSLAHKWHSISSSAFRNGFALHLQVGFRI